MLKAKADPRRAWLNGPCYYVSVVDGPRYALLAGPFRTHQEALDMVDAARREADKADPKAVWYAYGTCKTNTGEFRGILNGRLGLEFEGEA